MSREGDFLIYCLERYRQQKRLSGKQVVALCKQYGVLDFILQDYGRLHTTGDQHIYMAIDEHIREMQNETAANSSQT